MNPDLATVALAVAALECEFVLDRSEAIARVVLGAVRFEDVRRERDYYREAHEAYADDAATAVRAVVEEARNVVQAHDEADGEMNWTGPMVDLRLRKALSRLDNVVRHDVCSTCRGTGKVRPPMPYALYGQWVSCPDCAGEEPAR